MVIKNVSVIGAGTMGAGIALGFVVGWLLSGRKKD
jgi:3-hydroxyacyl-CoA dehydrogenase